MKLHAKILSPRSWLIFVKKSQFWLIFGQWRNFWEVVSRRKPSGGFTKKFSQSYNTFKHPYMIHRLKLVVRQKSDHFKFRFKISPRLKNNEAMIIISKDNILKYFTLRQNFFLICTHKAHFSKFQKKYDFQPKSLILTIKIEESQKLWAHT